VYGDGDTSDWDSGASGPSQYGVIRRVPVFGRSFVELQGRTPVPEFAGSVVTIYGSSDYRAVPVSEWTFQALDPSEWEVTIPNAPLHPGLVVWNLYAGGSSAYQGHCEPRGFAPDPG